MPNEQDIINIEAKQLAEIDKVVAEAKEQEHESN